MEEYLTESQKRKRRKDTICWNCEKPVDKQVYAEIDYVPTCKHCGVKYPEKPKLEAKLTLYQDEYLADRTQANFNKLFIPMNSLVFNIICSKLKGTSERNDIEGILDKVQWVLMKVSQYYINKPNFRIDSSFTAYLTQVALYPLYNKKDKKKSNNEISMFTPLGGKFINSTGAEKQLIDKLSEEPYMDGVFETEAFLFKETQKETVVNEMTDFIAVALETLYKQSITINSNKSFSETLTLALTYKHFVNQKNDRFFSELWRTCPIDLQDRFNDSIKLLKNHIKYIALRE